jgi:GMP synthase (glutamine-hydrolysing)
MILVVDLCYRKGSLSRDEFVAPITRIAESCGYTVSERHSSELSGRDISLAAGVILCGTALKDSNYLERAGEFSWLRECSVPVFGICAGMQVLSICFGGRVMPGCEIGMAEITVTVPDPILPAGPVFSAYELHSLSCEPPPDWVVLARSPGGIQAMRHPLRPLYGVMFHPEVRNERVVKRFLDGAGKEM